MNGSHCRTPAIAARFQIPANANWLFTLLIAALLSVAATSTPVADENSDEQYIQIMSVIDRADALRKSGQADAAKAKYKQAQIALLLFKRSNPLYSPKAVSYRLQELAERIETRPAIPSSTPSSKPKVKLEAPSASASSSKSSVKLLDPGAEPRKALRLHVKPGDKQTVIMTIKMTMDMGAATGGKPMNIPAMSLPADTTIQSVAPNGDITYEMVFGEPGVVSEPGAAAQMVQAVKTQLAAIKGLTVTGVVSDRGISKKVDLKAPPTADPAMRQTMEQIKDGMANIASPLPEEAIGAGAKWEVKMPIKSGGVSVDQTSDYQLISVDGDHISTSVTASGSAANQKIQNPAMGSAQMNLIEMTNDATGTVAADLSKLIPLQASMDVHSDLNSEITVGTKKQPFAMKQAMNVTMEAK